MLVDKQVLGTLKRNIEYGQFLSALTLVQSNQIASVAGACDFFFKQVSISKYPEKVNVLFLDSIGVNEKGVTYAEPATKIFNHIFPNSQIFISKDKRQNSAKGCSVFALDDVAHLTTLHLSDDQPLFDYLASTSPTPVMLEHSTNKVYAVNLPLALTRTMQSERLVKERIPQASASEQSHPVNKQHETAADSAKKSFHPVAPDTDKLRNTRLEYKLDKISQHVFDYLTSHSKEAVEAQMQGSTLAAFKDRITLQHRASATITKNYKSQLDRVAGRKTEEGLEKNASRFPKSP